MKILIILFTVLLTLTSCKTAESTITDIRDLPEDYGHYDIRDQAIADGVVVTFSGATANSVKITEFLQSAAKGESAFMRTIYYTTEGDPIITDYEFDGEKYIVTYDNSRDSFGTYIGPQVDYWPYAIFDGDRLWLSNWSDFYGDSPVDLENAGYGTHAVRYDPIEFRSILSDLGKLFLPTEGDVTGVFYAPDGIHRVAVSDGFAIGDGKTMHSIALPNGAVFQGVLWLNNKTALIVGQDSSGVVVYLTLDAETGEHSGWQNMTFPDFSELRQSAAEILPGDNWVGPGACSRTMSESFTITDSGGKTVDLQYRTVIRLSYGSSDMGFNAYLFFDYFTGKYLGCSAEKDGEPFSLDDIPEEDKALGIMGMNLDRYNIERGKKSLTLTVSNTHSGAITPTSWAVQRYGHGLWQKTKTDGNLSGSLEPLGEGCMDITIGTKSLKSGYYRVALYFTKDGEPYVAYCPFTVGSVSHFDTSDLPISKREVINDRGVGISVLRDAVPDDEIIMYAITATDGSDEFHTGCGAYLEILIDDTWCILPDRIWGFDAVGMTIGGEEREAYESLTITDYLLPLEEGHYRILKQGYFEKGHDVFIAGEFDVVDGSFGDYEVSAPDGLALEAVGATEPNPDGAVKRGWANYFQLDVALINDSDVTIIPDVMTALTKGHYDSTTHEHYRILPSGNTSVTTLQMVTADHNGNLIYADDSGLFNDDGSMNDGTYKMSRRVFFPDGTWCIVYGEFEVKGGKLLLS